MEDKIKNKIFALGLIGWLNNVPPKKPDCSFQSEKEWIQKVAKKNNAPIGDKNDG